MKGQAPLEPRHIVLLVHGPASVTKSAVKRAHRLAGRQGSVWLVPGRQEAVDLVSRWSGPRGRAVSGVGAVGLGAVANAVASHCLVVLHDDVSIDLPSVDALLARLAAGAPVVAARAGGRPAPHCFGMRARWWNDRPQDDLTGALAEAALVDVEVRHDLRCGVPPPARPLVVASLIVRDEAEMLPACLASLEGFADRVVVCDTGSTDDTVRIAKARGAQVVAVEWTDDFAAARNAALAYAADAEFVLWIDADERLETEDPTQVRAALAGGNHPEAYVIEVQSLRSDGPASVGLAQRLFRPDGLHFEGAIHEELRRRDGSAPTGSRFPLLRILHLGYAAARVDQAPKRERNLAIARRQHGMAPSAKTALDLARSLAFAGAPPDEVAAVLDDGLELARAHDPVRGRLQTMRAGLAFDSGDPAQALELAGTVLQSEAADDVAAALFARAGVALGQDHRVVEAVERFTPTGTLQVPRNQAITYAYGAAAALRIPRPSDARRWLQQAAAILAGSPDRWQVVLSATDTVEAEALWPALQSLPDLDVGAVIAAARALGDHERAEALAALAGQGEAPPPATGITLSFAGLRLPVEAGRLAAATPARRRVLDWSESESLTDRLRARSHGVIVTTRAGIIEGFSLPPGRPIDVAVGGIGPGEDDRLLSAIRRILDPAGLAMVWPLDAAGNALTGPAARDRLEQLRRSLAAAGFLAEPDMPHGVVAGRPVWDAGSFEAGAVSQGDLAASVVIVSAAPIPEELRKAYRASLPGTYGVHHSESGGAVAAPDVTLVTDPSIMPDPRWVQAVVDQTLDTGGTCGVLVIDQSGRVVQAGVDDAGGAVGAGEHAAGPLLLPSRPNTRLLPPYAVPGEAGPADVTTGTLIGTPPAITLLDATGARAATRLSDLFPRPLVLLGGPAPGAATPAQAAELEKLVVRLAESGRTLVYQWDDAGAAVDPWELAAWRRRGVVAFPPSPLRRDPTRFAPDIARPRADALVAALQPEELVYLSPGAIEWDYAAAAAAGPHARTIYAGPNPPARLTARADVVCTLADLADVILADRPAGESSQRAAAGHPAEIPRVEPVDQQPGLVSIVIPVHNCWELTAACLDSIETHTHRPYEVILVDNGSTDVTATEAGRRPVRVITNRVNRGFPAAVNQGIAAARGEYVCVLNNDTEVTDGWIDAMIEALSIEGTGLVGPRSNEVAGLQRIPEAPSMADLEAARQWARAWREGSAHRTWKIERLIGFCLLARRDTFEQLGGFDEGFGIGNYEDDELGRRARRHGLSLRVADAAVVLHHGSATFESLDLDYAALLHAGARRFAAGEPPPVHTAALVLSDGSPAEAAAAAASALAVAGRVVIAERGALPATELAAAAVPGDAVEVAACDWADASQAAALAESLPAEVLMVMGAGERVQLADWGAARAEIESIGLQPAEVRTSSGSEVRLVPVGPAAVDSVGTHSTCRVRYFGLASTPAG